MAIQSDGKILVVGHTAIDATPPAPDLPSTFAIARYHSDGNLDTGFGTGGRVSGSVNGIARAVAIQPDGKIVLAGDFELALSNGTFVSDFVVARFNANGSLDLPFGTSGTGQVATDIGGAANSGRNLVLQPNGAIVVSRHTAVQSAGVRAHRRRPLQRQRHARYELRQRRQAHPGRRGCRPGAGAPGRRQAGPGRHGSATGRSGHGALHADAPQCRRRRRHQLRHRGHGQHGTERERRRQRHRTAGRRQARRGRHARVFTNPNFIVARYNSNGSLDTGFANAGALSIDFFGFEDVGENVLVQPDGKIVVGGLARNNVDGYGLARILP